MYRYGDSLTPYGVFWSTYGGVITNADPGMIETSGGTQTPQYDASGVGQTPQYDSDGSLQANYEASGLLLR